MNDLPRANARRALLVLVVAAASTTVVGLVIGLLVGAVIVAIVAGLVAGVLLALWVRARATDLVIDATGAVPASASEHPRLFNLVEGLCLSSGVPVPDLFVVDDPARNVLVAGRDPRRSAIVFTTGLLDSLDRIELEGVVAHQLARIRQDDVAPATLVAVLGRLTRLVVRAPLAPDRFLTADLEACQLTRYPPGLVGAMEKVSGASSVSSAPVTGAAHLWFAPPRDDHHVQSDQSHPSLEERISLLREL
jgi:heat shock protein HtpX